MSHCTVRPNCSSKYGFRPIDEAKVIDCIGPAASRVRFDQHDICPEVFEFDGSKAIAKVDKVPTEAEAACRDAAKQCPTEAIKIDEE